MRGGFMFLFLLWLAVACFLAKAHSSSRLPFELCWEGTSQQLAKACCEGFDPTQCWTGIFTREACCLLPDGSRDPAVHFTNRLAFAPSVAR